MAGSVVRASNTSTLRGRTKGCKEEEERKKKKKKNAGTENGQRYFPWSQRSADVELIARVKFKFREFDSSIEDRERVHRWSREPYGSRAPSMEIMGHDYTKKTLVGSERIRGPNFDDILTMLLYYDVLSNYIYIYSSRWIIIISIIKILVLLSNKIHR